MRKKLCSCLLLLLFFAIAAHAQRRLHIPGRPDARFLPPRQSQGARLPTYLRNAACASDSLVFTRQSQIDSFPITNPACTVVRYLTIDGANASPAITRLDSLRAITAVTENLTVSSTAVTDLSGLSGLSDIGSFLWVNDNPQLTHIGLDHLHSVYFIILFNMPNLTSLGELTFHLTNNSIGTVDIVNTGLSDMSGLDSLRSIPNIYVWGNNSMTNLHGLHHLTSDQGACDYGISIWGNGNLTDLSALNGISHINGDATLECSYNNELTSLYGLGQINNIGGGLWISGNSNLATLAELNPNLIIHNNNNDSVRIENNPQLSACSFGPLCNYLAGGGGALIDNNAPGCNDITEVQSGCNTCTTVSLRTWNGSADSQWDNPANWTPAGIPQACDSVVIPSGTMHLVQTNGNVTIHALTMLDNSYLDLNNFGMTVNGDLHIANGTHLQGGNFLHCWQPKVVSVFQAILEVNDISILSVKESLDLTGNYMSGNLTISDSPGRTDDGQIDGNYVDGNVSITVNADRRNLSVCGNQENTITGNLLVRRGGPSNIYLGQGNILHLGGDLSVDNSFGSGLELQMIEFNGSNDAHIRQLGTDSVAIDNFRTEKFGGMIIADQRVHVLSNAHFTFGIVRTAPGRELVFGPYAGIDQTSSGSWVWGPVTKNGMMNGDSFTFPIGDSVYSGVLRVIKNSFQQVPDIYTATYFHKNPSVAGYDTAHHAASLSTVSGKEFWTVDHSNGNTGLRVILHYDPNVSQVTNSIYNLRAAQWTGSQWRNNGAQSVTGNLNEAFVTPDSVTVANAVFTLGYVYDYHPVITLGNMDTAGCKGAGLRVRITVDTPMLSNNNFQIQLSDSSGSFDHPYTIGNFFSNHSDSTTVYIPYYIPTSALYRLRVLGTLPADTSVNSKPLSVHSAPTTAFTIIGPNPACSLTPLKYYASNREAGVTYNWTIYNGTLTANADTAYVTWNAPTSNSYGTLALTPSNGCGNGNGYSTTVDLFFAPPATPPVLSANGRWLNVPAPGQGLTVSWYRNGSLITGASNVSYYAAQAGSYTAAYASNCSTGPVSNAIVFSANSQAQTITFPAIPDHVFSDSTFVINATSSSGLPVEFTIISGPGSIPGNVFHITGTGRVTIRASQQGSDVYDTAAVVTRTFVINKAAQTITFARPADRIYTGVPFDLSASSTSALPVSFTVISGSATISGNTLTPTGAGTVTVRATQAGDTNYLAATPVDRSFCLSAGALGPITGPNSICPGVTVTYSVADIPGATFTWRIAGGATLASTTSTVNHSWPAPGQYTLIVSATGGCGAPSPNDTLKITALTSVAPDSVRAMLPADGATNLQLPLNLSWVPAHPDLFYTYDLYIWRADSARPSTPYATNLTAVNYILPINSGLSYNKTYNWMVVAHNGSCTVLHTGPVQQFTLAPLPDLLVEGVTAPTTAFSGQPMTVTWTVRNAGPGRTTTNQHWTDAVFLSKDSVLTFNNTGGLAFPIVPLLVAAQPNVSSLDSGQLYTATATFNLPINYSGQLYAHVVTNYNPAADNAVTEAVLANDTAHALPPTTVLLSPAPDLQVDTVLTPNNTFSGSTINVVYKVRNHGQANASGSWTDKIYISKDPLFNLPTATQLKFPNPFGTYYVATEAKVTHNTLLPSDSSYTFSANVVVPNFIYGTYFIYVVTNTGQTVYEGANTDNNANHGPAMQVFLTATPAIVPINVSIPANVSNTQPLTLSWTEKNNGAYDNIEKNKAHYSVPGGGCTTSYCVTDANGNTTCTPVRSTNYRDSTSFGSSYWIDRVYISTDSSGLNLATATQLGDVNHGIQGLGYTVQDALYPSVCGGLGTTINTYPVLTPNAGFPTIYNYTVPDNMPEGKYYFYVYANPLKTVYEYPGLPQITRSNAFTVSWPDLTVPAMQVPASGASGQPVLLSYDLQNNGQGGVYSHRRKDYIYLGNNSGFDATAVLIDSIQYPSASLSAGGRQSLQKQLILPNGVAGLKYVFIRANADSSFRETNLNNNANVLGAPINITLTPAPDLLVSSIGVAGTIYSATPTPFRYTIANTGAGTASGTWKDSIFVSCSPAFSPSTSYLVAVRTQQSYVTASGSYSDSFQLTLPLTYTIGGGCLDSDTAHLYFYVKTNANNGVYEAVTNNNALASAQVTVINSLVDQVVTRVAAADSAFSGRSYKVSWSVLNQGLNPNNDTYSQWVDAAWLSTDSVLNSSSVFLGYRAENTRLNHNQSYSDSVAYNVPSMTPGDYYLLVRTNANNQIVAERNINNNTGIRRNTGGQALRVHVANPAAPDLVDSILSVPATIAAGQPFTVVYRVTNRGAGATYQPWWSDVFMLNTSLQPSAIISYANEIRLLQPGQSYIDSATITLPLSTVAGNYLLQARTNWNNQLYESDYTNNAAFRFVTVYIPAPVDLLVENVTAADTLILGKTAAIGWNLRNNSGNTASGQETDGIYLGRDTASVAASDVLLGTKVNRLNILPLNSATITASPVISGVVEGSYYLKVRTDIVNNIAETDKQNNTGITPHRVYVKVKELPMDVPTPDTLTGNYIYYKLIVPHSLAGKTIAVQLQSADSTTTNNQLYIGLGYLPSAAHFDYTFSRPNFGNQRIIIESVTDSVYYITAHALSTGQQAVTLQATVLPFALLTVTANHGGNTGNVTVLLRGSQFRDSMSATLRGIGPGNTITASSVYFVNGTTAYATFNLQGAPLGLYDLSLTRTDASVASLPASFTVEKTNNGGLITGPGSNTGQTGSGTTPGCDPGAPSGLNAQLQTEIVIPPKVFVNWPFTIQINYTNTTNVDIPAQVRILYSLDGAPIALTQAGLAAGATTLTIEFKDAGVPGNIIRAGGSGTIIIHCKAPANAFAHEQIHFNLQ